MKRPNRVVLVVLALVAVVLALRSWRGGGEREVKPSASSAQANGAPARAAGTAQRQDPRTLKRASIAGTITDKAKVPIAGARVCAQGWSRDAPSDALREPTCVDADGRGAYRIAKLLSAEYQVTAVAKTFRPGAHEPRKHKRTFRLAPGEVKTGVDIALDPGGVEITGTVSDITGGPVAHAQVRASASRWGESLGPPVEADDKGHYTMWVKPGSIRVTANADGYADASEHGQAPGTFDILLTPESSLTGTVVDARTGAPIDGARVSVQSTGFGWDRESDRSDAEGTFRVSRLTPGRYVTEAITESGFGRTAGSTLVGLAQHVDGVVVRLHPAMRIQGKVMIRGDQPAVCEDGYAYFRDDVNDRWLSGRADPDGTITVEGVVPGTYTPTAVCRGYANVKEVLDPVVVKDKDVLGLVWEVEAGATITGKVLTRRGEPVADAEITARSTGGGARDRQAWSQERSNADGTYELDGLRAGRYLLEPSSAKAVAPRDGFTVEAPAGKVVEKDLVLDDGGTIEGVVVDEQGKPVDGVKVDARSMDNSVTWDWDGGAKADAAGKFTLRAIRPGEYWVTATRGWFETLRKPGSSDDENQGEKATVTAGATTNVRLVVESQRGTIKGVVVDAGGKPVSDAYLSAARESDAAGARQTHVSQTRGWVWGDEAPVLTNVDGSFVLAKLSPGKYTVRAYRKGGGEAVAEHVAVGATARLQIEHTGSIAGIAKRASGPPPDGITVTVANLESGLAREEKFYKTGGKFTVRDLPQGHIHLTVSTAGGSKRIELDLADGENKTGIEVTFDALVTITGRVVELGTDKPIPGMRVAAQLATGGDRMTFTRGGEADNDHISDEQGRFTVKRVPVGQIVVQGVAKDYKHSDYTWFRAIRTITGTSAAVDIGDVGVVKRRVKAGEKTGALGINFAQQPPGTPPDKVELKVSYIYPTGPAVTSGIQVGDVVTQIDGIDVTGANAMHAWTLMNAPPGTKLTLGLARGATVSIVLAAP